MFLVILTVFCLFTSIDSQHEDHQFKPGSRVKQLSTETFDNITKIGLNQEKPWFIFFYAHWCTHCFKLIPFWEEVAEKFHRQINFGAIECEENEYLRDRFDIPLFPKFMYFSTEGQIIDFIGYRTMENITQWIQQKKWRYEVPHFTEIPEKPHTHSYLKRFIRRIFHPIALGIYMVLFVSFLVGFIIWDNKQQARKLQEAKLIKMDLVRRKREQQQEEYQSLLSKID